MSLTSYRAAPPRAGCSWVFWDGTGRWFWGYLVRFGGDLLSRVLRRSTIGATALNCRVREGIGCFARAMTTKPEKRPQHQPPVSGGYPCLAAFDCPGPGMAVALPLLDQIKPVEQLVPVS